MIFQNKMQHGVKAYISKMLKIHNSWHKSQEEL